MRPQESSSVRRSVLPSVRPSVTLSFNTKLPWKQSKIHGNLCPNGLVFQISMLFARIWILPERHLSTIAAFLKTVNPNFGPLTNPYSFEFKSLLICCSSRFWKK